MHPTTHALKHLFVLSLGLYFTWSSEAGQVEQKVLDLTKQSTSENHSMGVPGESVGGMAGEPNKAAFELPIRLEIKRLHISGTSVALELQLTNLGNSPLDVPSCLDASKAFRAGAVNRRSLEFGLAVRSRLGSKSELIEVTFGSSKPECSTFVEPHGALLIIMEARIPESIREIGKQAVHVPVRAFASEVRFEDDRYYVRNRSERIDSQSTEASF